MKYKHRKTLIIVRQNQQGFYIDDCNTMKLPPLMVEDSADWEKVVEIPQEVKDKLMEFYRNHVIFYDGGKITGITVQQFKDYFGI